MQPILEINSIDPEKLRRTALLECTRLFTARTESWIGVDANLTKAACIRALEAFAAASLEADPARCEPHYA